MKRIRILDTPFDACTEEEAVAFLMDLVRSGRRGIACTVNVAIMMMMRSITELRAIVEEADLILADGQPIVWTARLLGQPLKERVAGIDLIDAIAARAAAEDFRVYFLGAELPVVEEVVARLRERHSALNIVGYADGYFSNAEARERAVAVSDSGAQILFVGMGVPRQERFIRDHWEDLNVNLAIGVGGSFDVLAGVRRRAPRFLQRAGLEWLFRLAQEPGRLWKRYLVTNLQFLFLATGALLARPFRQRRGRTN